MLLFLLLEQIAKFPDILFKFLQLFHQLHNLTIQKLILLNILMLLLFILIVPLLEFPNLREI